jgi:PmbA protein
MSETDSIQGILREEKIDQWDIYVEKAEEYDVQLRNFDVEAFRGPIRNLGYAIRIIKPKGKKVGIGIGAGNSLEPEHIRTCLKTASVGAKITEFPSYLLPRPGHYPEVKIADPKIVSHAESTVTDKAEELVSLLRQSKTVLPTFGKIRTYNVSTGLSNSEGVRAEKKETLFYVELALKAERSGKLAEYWPMAFVRRAEDMQLAEKIPTWTRLAEDTLDAKVPKTMKTAVIFTPHTLSDILPNIVGFHCLGSTVFKGLSRFKKEQQIGSDRLTINDDGVHDYALGSSPFDDEGSPQTRTTLVEKGIHKSFLYDAMYAATMDAHSTGNGQKLPAYSLAFTRIDLKYSLMPSMQPTNISVKPGDMSLDEMIKTTREGVYIEQLSSASSDSLTTSFGSEIRNAYLIRNGELVNPLKGGQISGFLLDSQTGQGQKVSGLLSQVSGMTKETQLAGKCLTPHIRFDQVQVSGK